MVKKGALLALLIAAGGFFIYSCGQAVNEGTTTIPSTVSSISGLVLVPASSATGLGSAAISSVKALATSSSDGVSDTPLAGASVEVCDAATGNIVTGIATVTADSTGTFTIEVPSNVTLPDEVYFRCTKTSGSKTAIVNAMYSKSNLAAGSRAEINAGTTLAYSKVKDLMASKVGDLLSQATLPEAKKAELMAQIKVIFESVFASVGTISQSNIPNLVVSGTGLSVAEKEKKLFQNVSGVLANEFVAPSGWDATSAAFENLATETLVGGTLPAGVKIQTDIWPNWTGFPTGLTLPPSASFIGSAYGGASFIPSYYYDKFPTGAYFGASFALPTGVILPSGVQLGTAFNLPSYFAAKLPVDAYLYSGCNLPTGALIPKNAGYGSGFVMPSFVSLQSGNIIPSYVSFQPGLLIPTGISFQTGFIMPTGMSYQTGFVMPTGLSYQSGFVMPSNVSLQSGFVIPSGISLQPGFIIGSGVSFQSGVVIGSGVSFGSGAVIPSGVSMQSGVIIGSGAIIDSGATVPSGVSMQSGAVVGSGAIIDSGAYVPSGVSYGSGYSGYSGYSGMY